MAMSKHVRQPVLQLNIWQQDGKLFFVEKEDLQAAIARGGKSEEQLMREMQFGYQYIQDLLEGKGVELWEARFIERRISPIGRVKNVPVEF